MKKLIFLFALMMGGFLFEKTFAQAKFKANIVSQPIWGPAGFDHVEYYFLPDIQAYYYVPNHKFIYAENGRWISKSYLPVRYKDFDMYSTRKVIINEPKPYLNHQDNMARYAWGKEIADQRSIRDSHELKYFANKNHPEHAKWKVSKGSHVDISHGKGEKHD